MKIKDLDFEVPFEGLKVQICNHDISISITARSRSFNLGQRIEDDE